MLLGCSVADTVYVSVCLVELLFEAVAFELCDTSTCLLFTDFSDLLP